MTLQQLKYVITVAETGTITEAANQLFISQPSHCQASCVHQQTGKFLSGGTHEIDNREAGLIPKRKAGMVI